MSTEVLRLVPDEHRPLFIPLVATSTASCLVCLCVGGRFARFVPVVLSVPPSILLHGGHLLSRGLKRLSAPLVELGTVGHGPLSLSRLVVLRIARAHSLHRFVPFVEQGASYARIRWIALRRQ